MYANRVTPVQRMRKSSSGRLHSSTHGINPSSKRRQLISESITPNRMNGDYQVLRTNVERERNTVQQARVALANSLDQLGQHHVRQHEYDDAMDAFTEALREKRSVFWQISSPSKAAESAQGSLSPRSNSFSSNLLSGVDNTGTGIVGDELPHEKQDRAIDEIVNTLRNMGNVHSLRGEQDEAMRYFTEVTSLRAQKSSQLSIDPTSLSGAGEGRSVFSGLNDDTSTLMSEINEDVKALDELFRSISFRNQANGSSNGSESLVGTSANGGMNEKRKSKSTRIPSSNNKRRKSDSTNSDANSGNKRELGNGSGTNIAENEPFKRSTSSLCIQASGNEITEAMDMYRSVLDGSYLGSRLQQHKELLNSLSLRAELLNESRKNGGADHPITGSSLESTNTQQQQQSMSYAAQLELAIEIYDQVLAAHEESRLARKEIHKTEEEESLASSTSLNSNATEAYAASMVASTLICMGSIYYKLGNRVDELRMYREAKTVYKKAFGKEHVFVAGTRKNIGMVLAERGEYELAMSQFDKAMRIYLNVNQGNEMNRDVASAISCMGNVKNRVGELDSALKQYMEALRIYKYLHGKQESQSPSGNEESAVPQSDAIRDVTSTLKVIGMVHAKKGDLDTAMGFFQEAMSLLQSPEIEKTSAGRETKASVLTRVASIHLKKGDLDQSMAHYREAYDLTTRNRGTTNHPEVAGILHYIGGIYHKRADFDEAMACYQEAIRIYHATLGPGNPTVAGTLVMVGSIYYKRRNLDSAMMFYREALRLNRDAYGMHHPDVAPILKSVGTILTKKGEYHEAYDIFRDVLSIKSTVHGMDHPEVASAYKSLGNVHYKLGDLADAERQYRHAMSIYRRTKGEDHPDTMAAKTTIEHLRYWMRERDQRQMEQRHSKSTPRSTETTEHATARTAAAGNTREDERSC